MRNRPGYCAALIALISLCLLTRQQAGGQVAATSVGEGWALLADGDPNEARSLFAQQLIYLGRRIQGNSRPVDYVECERGLVLALLFQKQDNAARAMLDRIGREYAHEPPADRLMLAGHWPEALKAYRDSTSDNSITDPHPDQPDHVISIGANLALHGDLKGAIHAWSTAPDGGGPYDLGSLQKALIAMAFIQLKAWPSAEEYLLEAARYRRAINGDDLDSGNQTALAMLLAYRSHFPRGEHQYTWPPRRN